MEKTIQMSYTPGYVLEYFRNWALKQKNAAPAEQAMFKDITTMLEVAKNVMVTVPADSEKSNS